MAALPPVLEVKANAEREYQQFSFEESQKKIAQISGMHPIQNPLALTRQHSHNMPRPLSAAAEVQFDLQSHQEIINLDREKISDDDLDSLIKTFDSNEHYTMVQFLGWTFRTEKEQTLLNIILRKKQLLSLRFVNCEFSLQELEKIASSSIKALTIEDQLKESKKLEESMKSKEPKDNDELFKVLSRSNLKFLHLSMPISEQAASILATSSIESLSLENSRLSTSAALQLLKSNHLRYIEMSGEHRLNADVMEKRLTLNQNLVGFDIWHANHTVNRLGRSTLAQNAERQVMADKNALLHYGKTGRLRIYYSSFMSDLFKILKQPVRDTHKTEDLQKMRAQLLKAGLKYPNMLDHEVHLNGFVGHLIVNEQIFYADRYIQCIGEELDANIRDIHGKTILILCAKLISANLELAALLKYTKNIFINAQDSHGRSALHYRCAYGDLETALQLVERGGDIYLKDKFGLTPLDYLSSDRRMMQDMLHEVCVDGERDIMAHGNGLLYQQLSFDKFECSYFMPEEYRSKMQEWAYPATKETLKRLRAYFDSISGQLSSNIVDSKATIDEITSALTLLENRFTGQSVMEYCLASKTPEKIQEMSKHLLNAYTTFRTGKTHEELRALMLPPVSHSKLTTLSEEETNYVKADKKSVGELEGLIAATEKEPGETEEALEEMPKPIRKDNVYAAIDILNSTDDLKKIQEGLNQIDFLNPRIVCAFEEEIPATVQMLRIGHLEALRKYILCLGANFDPTIKYDNQSLFMIVAQIPAAQEILNTLLALNIDLCINMKCSNGRTVLHYLCLYGNFACAEEVIKRGGDIMLRDSFGKTPIDYLRMKEVSQLKAHMLSHLFKVVMSGNHIMRDIAALRGDLFHAGGILLKQPQRVLRMPKIHTNAIIARGSYFLPTLENIRNIQEYLVTVKEQPDEPKGWLEDCRSVLTSLAQQFKGVSILEHCSQVKTPEAIRLAEAQLSACYQLYINKRGLAVPSNAAGAVDNSVPPVLLGNRDASALPAENRGSESANLNRGTGLNASNN